MALENLFSEFEPVSSQGRIVPMEGMRGFAAMLVFLVHFRALFGHYAEGTVLFSPVYVLGALGHTGVDVFFILSGYLIYGIVMDGRFTFWRFFDRRVRRLYPTFLVVFAVYLSASLLLPTRSKLPSSWLEATPYVAANLLMLPGMLPIKPIITVAWSLSYEWFFYLLLPVVVASLVIRKWPWQRRAVFFVALSAVYGGLAARGNLPNSRLILFGAGILLWEVLHSTKVASALRRPGEFAAAALFTLNLLAIGLYGSHIGTLDVVLEKVPGFYAPSLFVTGFFFTLYSIAYGGFLSRIFSWKPLRWMGNMSYSYYLIHGITLVCILAVAQRLSRTTHLSAPAFLLVFVACFSATVATSGILYLSIERPLSLARSSRRVAATTLPGKAGAAAVATPDLTVKATAQTSRVPFVSENDIGPLPRRSA